MNAHKVRGVEYYLSGGAAVCSGTASLSGTDDVVDAADVIGKVIVGRANVNYGPAPAPGGNATAPTAVPARQTAPLSGGGAPAGSAQPAAVAASPAGTPNPGAVTRYDRGSLLH